MRRWVVPMLAAVTSFAVLGGLGVSPASAADLVSADGTTVITEVVLPPLPAGSSQPATLAATVSYGGSACTPCSVHFYVGGLGWAQDEYQYLSNGGSGRFTATALPSSVGQYPVQVVLYGADGMPKETVGIGTLLVGQVVDGLTISPVTASATHVLPGATVTVGADVLVPSGTGTLIPAPTGTPFTVEFRAPFSQWSAVATAVTAADGRAAVHVAPSKTGSWRVRSDQTVGTPVSIEVASEVRVTPAEVSASQVAAGRSATVSAKVWGRYAAGYIAAADTPFTVQYAPLTGSGGGNIASGRTTGGGMARATVRPTATGFWSVTAAGVTGEGTEITVSVAEGTGSFIVHGAQASVSKAAAGDKFAVSTAVEDTYTDGAVRPAAKGTPFTVQFRLAGTSTWGTAVSGQLDRSGRAVATVTATRTGWWRAVVGGRPGAAVSVPVLQPTSTASFGLPATSRQSVVSGLATTLSAAVKVRYTDGVYRAAPVGTSYAVEFSAVKSGPWKAVAVRKLTTKGKASTPVTVSRSGYWRLTKSGRSTAAQLVKAAPVRPTTVEVDWSRDYQMFAHAWVLANNNKSWNHKTELVLQYRASRYDSWQNLDYDYATGDSQASVMASRVLLGYYRVFAPAYRLASEERRLS